MHSNEVESAARTTMGSWPILLGLMLLGLLLLGLMLLVDEVLSCWIMLWKTARASTDLRRRNRARAGQSISGPCCLEPMKLENG